MLIEFALSLALQAGTPGADAPPPEIVVQGTRAAEQQIRDYIKAVTDLPFDGQVGRFHAAACPVAVGLPEVQNRLIAERIRAVASAAHIPLAAAGCTPNVFVIVTADRHSAVEQLGRRFPSYFEGLSPGQVRRLSSGASPAVAWQVSRPITSDGVLLSRPIGQDYYVLSGTQEPSRIRSASVPDFVASMVVVDVKAAAGLTITQLADYAAMRTFAATDPDRILKTGAPTIITLLGQPDDKPLPLSLTYWDLAYLKSLYSTDNAYYARFQRGHIAQRMREDLAHAGVAQPHE